MNRLIVPMFLLATLGTAHAAVPAFIPYSGRLTDGTAAGESTTLDLTLTLYNAATDGGVIFRGLHPDVPVVDGYFSVFLGTCNAAGSCDANPANATFPAALPAQLWLGVAVNAGTELSPRQPIGSVPYALHCGDTTKVGGENLAGLDARFVNVNGDTMSGPLLLPAAGLEVSGQNMEQEPIGIRLTGYYGGGSTRLVSHDAGRTGTTTKYGHQFLIVTETEAHTSADHSPLVAMQIDHDGWASDETTVVSFPNGNVGVRTIDPQKALDVVGDARVSGTLFAGCAVVQGDWTNPDGTQCVAYASCPAGAIAMGGGAETKGWDMRLLESYPSSTGSQWRISVLSPSALQCRASATCCRFGN